MLTRPKTILKRPSSTLPIPPSHVDDAGVDATHKGTVNAPASDDASDAGCLGIDINPEGKAHGQSEARPNKDKDNVLEKIMDALGELPMDLDDALETNAEPGQSLMDGDPLNVQREYYTRDDKTILRRFNAELMQSLKVSKPEWKRSLASTRNGYFADLGGREACSTMQSQHIDMIGRVELICHIITHAGLKAGIVRWNRSSNKLMMNPAMEKLPQWINLWRLLSKGLSELSKSGRTVQRATFEYAVTDGTPMDEVRDRAAEFMQLLGQPLDMTKLKKVTLEKTEEP